MLTVAIKAARRAGVIINRASRDIDGLTVTSKRQNDFVTEVDKAAEAAVIDALLQAYPGHAILAEESGATGKSEYTWIIDPLDGTTNFIHGFPQYAVSIALQHRGVLTQAVVFDPTRNELFTASRGRGAFLNDRRIRVAKRTRLEESLIGTGFPYRELGHLTRYTRMFKAVVAGSAGVRRAGAPRWISPTWRRVGWTGSGKWVSSRGTWPRERSSSTRRAAWCATSTARKAFSRRDTSCAARRRFSASCFRSSPPSTRAPADPRADHDDRQARPARGAFIGQAIN